MKNSKILAIILGIILIVSSNILRADEEDKVALTGNFEFGYRHVDVSGNINKYYEDLNIKKGPRLLSLNFDLLPSGKYKNYFDLLSVYASTIGGDPFESYGFTLKKHGAFNFRYGHRKSTYSYQDIILTPDLANISQSSGGDFHTFSFERNFDELYFDLRLTKRAKLFLSYDRQQRAGESTTTLDIARDEFEFDKPLDELKTEYRAGFQLNFAKLDFYLEGSYRDYENNSRIFLPGFSEGANTTNFAELFSFELMAPYDFTMPMITARINARPTKRIQAAVSYAFSDLDMNLNYYEKGLGTNYNNTPLDYLTRGKGQINRKFNLADVDLSYRIHDKVYLIGGFKYDNLEQDGELSINGGAPLKTSLDIKTLIYEAGTQVLPYKTLSISGGLRFESREASLGEKEETERTSFFFNTNYNPSNKLNVMGEYERGTYKDPYTLISPTDSSRIKIRGKFKPLAGFDIILTYLRRDLKNEDSGGKFDSNTYSLDLAYSLKSKLYLSAGYSRLDIRSSISNVVTYFLQPWNIRYESANNIFRGSVKYLLNKNLSAGAMADYYQNSGTWELDWATLSSWIKYSLASGYSLSLSYRWSKYNEKKYNFDDYSSSIFTLGFGYSF